MNNFLHFLSIAILISGFILVSGKRVDSYIKTFRLQSGLLAIIALLIGIQNIFLHGDWEILVVGLMTVAIKVLYIPHLLTKTILKIEYKVEKDFFLNIPISILICCGLVILAYFTVTHIEDFHNGYLYNGYLKIYLANAMAVILIGLFFMISRKKAIGQIIGFLVIENGLFTAAILSTEGMPMLVELGIFFDVLTAVLIMGILVFRINENFETIDLNKLKNLRG